MSDIVKTYTDNPFIDELVYYVKLLAINCVIKNEQEALDAETADTLKNSDLYMSCVEGRTPFELLDIPGEVLVKLGIKGDLYNDCLTSKYNIPEELQEKARTLAIQYYIDNFNEQNEYYRMLIGLPPLGDSGVYLKSTDVPDGLDINISIPVHLMSVNEIRILSREGVISTLIARYPKAKYLNYIDKEINLYDARKSMNFQILYMPDIESDVVAEKFKLKYEVNRDFTIKTIYSEAFKYQSDYYDNVMIIFIILQTMMDLISEVQEHIIKKDVFDARCIEFIFNSYGVPYYSDIPIKYQINMMKNLNTLLKYKSTNRCMVEICSLFGFDNAQVFKYFLLRDRNLTSSEEYQFNYKKKLVTTYGEVISSSSTAIIYSNASDITIPFPFEDFLVKGNALKVKLNGNLLSNPADYTIENYTIFKPSSSLSINNGDSLEFNFYYSDSTKTNNPITGLDSYKIEISTSQYTIETDGQLSFPITFPYENYLSSNGTVRLVAGSLWINPSRYTIENNTVTFTEEQDWNKAGRVITYLFVYSKTLTNLKSYIGTTTAGDVVSSNIEIPEPIKNYATIGNEFYMDIGGTYVSQDRYGTTGSSAVFIDSSDVLATGRDAIFNMYYLPFTEIEMVSTTVEIKTESAFQRKFTLEFPFDTYLDDGYQVYVKYADTILKSTQFNVLKNTLSLTDTSLVLRSGITMYVTYIYPKDRTNTKIEAKSVTPTSDLQQKFTIPFPFDHFVERGNYFYVSLNGVIINPDRYEINKDEINLFTVKDSVHLDEELVFFFFYNVDNKYVVKVKQASTVCTSDGQKNFNINFPFFDYIYTGHNMFVTIGSTLLDTSRYSISENTLTITDDTYIEAGRSLIFTFIYHSIYESYNNYIITSNATYDINNSSGAWGVLIPYPFENFLTNGNSMTVSVGGHILDPLMYDITEDNYITFPDVSLIKKYGNVLKFDFIYNKAKQEIVLVDDNDKNYELKFVKVPLTDNIDNYLRNKNNFLDYDTTTSDDELWDAYYSHDEIKSKIVNKEFSYTRTKYISIDTLCEMTNLSFDIPYFFNMLFDNVLAEERLVLEIPYIRKNKNFKLSDVFTYLIAVTYIYNGLEDDIMNTTEKVLYVKGFNFKADIAALKDYVEAQGFTLKDLGVSDFDTEANRTITSISQLLDIFTNNKKIYNHVVNQMYNASNKRIYRIYKKIYDSLMTIKFTEDFFSLDTGRVPTTYTDYLHYRDTDLYNSLIYMKSIDDENTRNAYILEMFSEVIFYLDQYISTDDYKNIYSKFPTVSTEYLKKYVEKVINFFKSYKVELLGISTIYEFGNRFDNMIRPIDEIELLISFLKEENSIIKDSIDSYSSMTESEKLSVVEKVYLDISTWVEHNYPEYLSSEIIEKIAQVTLSMIKDDTATDNIREKIAEITESIELVHSPDILESINVSSKYDINEKMNIFDKAYISYN